LQEQHSETFDDWSAIIKINTDGKSLIMKSSLDQVLKWITADDTTLNTYFTHGAERSSI